MENPAFDGCEFSGCSVQVCRSSQDLRSLTGESTGPTSVAAFAHLDATRLSNSIRRNTAKAKRRRQHVALLRTRQEEVAIEAEGGPS